MVAVITGAARGLGLALVKKIAENGHQVAAAVRNVEAAEKLAAFAKTHSNVRLYSMDVSDWASIEEAKNEIEKDYKAVDLVINNAGVLFEDDKVNRIQEAEVTTLRKTMEINVEAPILVLKAFFPLLEKSGEPEYYTITSESTMEGSWPGIPIYSLSKVAAGKAVSIMKASLPEHYQVLAIHPGRMDTDMGHNTAQIPPEEAAEGICGLAEGKVRPESWYVDYKGKRMQP